MFGWGVFFLFFGTICFISVFSWLVDFSYMFYMSFLDLSFLDGGFLVVLDFIGATFFSILLMMTGCVYVFGSGYMVGFYGYNHYSRFTWMLNSFVLSMVLLMFLPSLLWVLMGWDGLGVTSVLLVLFYNVGSSWSAGLKTYLVNRLGDGFLVAALLMFLYQGHLFMKYWLSGLWFMVLLLGLMTKSAQYPFSGWLPVAMAAPTPVSALVHSSTLVTAGVYILIRFFKTLKEDVLTVIAVLGLFTMLVASFASCVEWDSKKIVAFSTLSQLGLMCFTLGMGLVNFCFYHLLCHALFKALLFISVGYLLVKNYHLQDIRYMWKLHTPGTSLLFIFVNLCLGGFIFFCGFYTKDLMLDSSFQLNLVIWGFFYFSLFLTPWYSFRLYYWIFGKFKSFKKDGVEVEIKWLGVFPLICLSFVFGGMLYDKISWSMLFSFSPYYFKMFMLVLIFGGATGALLQPLNYESFFFTKIFNLESIKGSLSGWLFSDIGSYFYKNLDQGNMLGIMKHFKLSGFSAVWKKTMSLFSIGQSSLNFYMILVFVFLMVFL